MKRIWALIGFMLLLSGAMGQTKLNRVVIANGGQFGNNAENVNLYLYDPVLDTVVILDTIHTQSVQGILIESNKYAYVPAQDSLVKYDLDKMLRVASAAFPGVSAYQLELWEDKIIASNFYSQTSDNVYILNKDSLDLVASIPEIIREPSGILVIGDSLYVGQNLKGNVDACPPFGCFSDTAGYLAVIDLPGGQWVRNIDLNNGGRDVGRLIEDQGRVLSLNNTSNSISVYSPGDGSASHTNLMNDVDVSFYQAPVVNFGGNLFGLFDGELKRMSLDSFKVESFIDTFFTAVAMDTVNGDFYLTATDYFTYSRGMRFDANGNFKNAFPTGFSPDAIAVQYNRKPDFKDFERQTGGVVVIGASNLGTDPDGDDLVITRVVRAPLNGSAILNPDGSLTYTSLSSGDADTIIVQVCDRKYNPWCEEARITLSATSTGINQELAASFSLYPNPASSAVAVISGFEADIEVYDMGGALLLRDRTLNGEALLSIGNFSQGIYFVILRTDSGFAIRKFSKF